MAGAAATTAENSRFRAAAAGEDGGGARLLRGPVGDVERVATGGSSGTLPPTSAALAAKAPHFRTVFYERLMEDVTTEEGAMAATTGLDSVPSEWDGLVRQDGGESKWQEDLPQTELDEIMANPDCQAYMDAAGYGADGNYDNLKAPEA